MGKKGEFKFELIDVIAVLEENPKGNWAKVLTRMSWNDAMPTYDIRNIDMSTINDEKPLFGKGISLSDKGCENLAKELLQLGFIDIEDIKEYINNEDSIFIKDTKHKVKIKRRD